MSADTVYHSPCRTGSVMIHTTPQCQHLKRSVTMTGEAPLEAPADAFPDPDRCPKCFGVEYTDPVVGDHLAACRAVADLDPETLADAVGVVPNTITHWENGDTTQSGAMATAVREALAEYGVDVEAYADVTIDPPVGEEIRKRRHARGWTQAELAAKLPLTRAHLSGLEHERFHPSRITAYHIQRVLGPSDSHAADDAGTDAEAPDADPLQFPVRFVGECDCGKRVQVTDRVAPDATPTDRRVACSECGAVTRVTREAPTPAGGEGR